MLDEKTKTISLLEKAVADESTKKSKLENKIENLETKITSLVDLRNEMKKSKKKEHDDHGEKQDNGANKRNIKKRGHSSISKKISKVFLNRQKHRKKVEALEPSFYLHAYRLGNNGEFLWDDGTACSTDIWEWKLRSERFYPEHWDRIHWTRKDYEYTNI